MLPDGSASPVVAGMAASTPTISRCSRRSTRSARASLCSLRVRRHHRRGEPAGEPAIGRRLRADAVAGAPDRLRVGGEVGPAALGELGQGQLALAVAGRAGVVHGDHGPVRQQEFRARSAVVIPT